MSRGRASDSSVARQSLPVLETTPSHILVHYVNSRRGATVLRQAAEFAAQVGAQLTVVVVAVTEPEDKRCCDTRAVYWNGVVRELAAEDVVRARALLGADTAAEFTVVTERSVTEAMALEVRRSEADVIVMPSGARIHPWFRSRRARQVQRRAPAAVVLTALGPRLPA